jgi:hypothetical protein
LAILAIQAILAVLAILVAAGGCGSGLSVRAEDYAGVNGLKEAQERVRELAADSVEGFDEADFTEVYDPEAGLVPCYGPGGPASATSWRDEGYSLESTVDEAAAERFLQVIKDRWDSMGIEYESSLPDSSAVAPLYRVWGKEPPFTLTAESLPSTGSIAITVVTPCIEMPENAVDPNGHLTGD